MRHIFFAEALGFIGLVWLMGRMHGRGIPADLSAFSYLGHSS